MSQATPNPELDAQAVNVIKGLVMDTIRKANSGHPGGPMSSADMAYVLFREFLRFDPNNTKWSDRDRFVLSAGHESSLLYALLHLAGFIGIEDLKAFRQFGSLTPGHPEVHLTKGVEATTGPLGQGVAMAVGMAVAEAQLAERLGKSSVDHHTYALASDGDFQEPVSMGAAALAGNWGLGKLIVLYDKNEVQLAGPTSVCDCTDYAKLYEAMCWQVIEIDGHDHGQIRKAIAEAKAETSRPTLIIGHTVMAKGTAGVEGDFNTHGAPLSPEEIAASKEKMGLPADEFFYVPEEIAIHFQSNFGHLHAEAGKWKRNHIARMDNDPEFEDLWDAHMADRSDIKLDWPEFTPGKKIATRKAWGACLDAITPQLPHLTGGSADLDPSNQTVKFRETTGVFCADNHAGRNLSFGVREFPMGAILNGMALHGGVVPFGATFLTFSDYERNALRMSALQELPVLHVFTHDSFYVGEDGPTHQPIEHVSSLRLIPNMLVLRPADANETKACLKLALNQEDKPSCLMLTRQGLPVLDPDEYPALDGGPAKGGYVLKDSKGEPEVAILASGSEVSLALDAAKIIGEDKVRVVSIPCMEIFDAQPEKYRRQVIPEGAFLAAAEAGRGDLWHKYVGPDGVVLCIDHFGASAPAAVLEKEYGFTPENLAKLISDNRANPTIA